MRNVDIHMDSFDMIAIAERIGTWDALWQAIGYLSTWSAGEYPKVVITRDGDTDLVAVYYRENGERMYVIGAVWHDTHYGFHS
jgi:hypothetical protein